MGPDRHPAGDEHHPGPFEGSADAVARGRAVIGQPLGGVRERPGARGQAVQHRSVGIVDLARAQRLTRGAQLIAGAEHRHVRAAAPR